MGLKKTIKNIAKTITGEVSTEILVSRGLKVGSDFNRQQGCFIDPTHCFLIEIGNNVTFSVHVSVLAHDASTKKLLGYTRIGHIIIGDNVFVGACSTILPNTSIGDNSIIGANSVVTKDVPANVVVAGNPARIICTVDEFRKKNEELMLKAQKFGREYRFKKNMKDDKKEELIEAVRDGIAFID